MKKEHLPVIGVGPLIVAPQLVLTAAGLWFVCTGHAAAGALPALRLPLAFLGVACMAFGVYLWYAANFRVKIDECIKDNRLSTTGVYALVRNPIYSAFFLACTGAVLLAGSLVLLAVPPLCWLYMTLMLKNTEERWLAALYGAPYQAYCGRVNRCIPWFPKKTEG